MGYKVVIAIFRLFLFSCLLLPATAGGQENTFTLEAFLQQVRSNHPMARQAELLSQEAKSALLAARGSFDPKLYGTLERKSFDGKNYFNLGEGGAKLPTWFGIEGKLAYNYASGIFLNPEDQLPADGQLVAGITLPLLQGLWIDERRANLSQARLLRSFNEAEQQLMRNDLLLEAAKSYWNWSLAQAWLQIYDDAVQVASIRLEGIRESWQQGDKPAIDTLEALLLVQDRLLQRNDAQLLLRNAALELQNFIWENDAPQPLNPVLRPVPPGLPTAQTELTDTPASTLAAAHPLIRQYDVKLRQLDVERRLKAEQLKPRLDLQYNLLGNGPNFLPDENSNFADLLRDNYKLGLSAGFPLLLRKERGSLQLANLKIQDTQFDLFRKQQEITNKIAAYQNDLRNLQSQLLIAAGMRDNYARLLAGENEKFAIGESSLFLVNSRENKLIEANLKLVKLQAEIAKAMAGLQWAAGLW